MSWQQTVENTVTGLGYDLVDIEHAARGLLRVTIDRVPGRTYRSRHAEPGAAPDQGEFVTVEDCELVTRQLQLALEVDGLDFQRFAGQEVAITLKLPFQGRKNWRGVLEAADEGWRLLFKDGKVELTLDFRFDEVRDARLVPVVDFKRKGKGGQTAARPPREAAGVDGGLDQ